MINSHRLQNGFKKMVLIYKRNIQLLATEMCKINQDLSLPYYNTQF